MAYFPDTGPLYPVVFEKLRGVDALIHDSTFVGRNWNPEVHTNVEGCIQLGRDLGAKATYLTHCTMHFDEPRTAADLREEFERISAEGMKVVLPHDGLRISL